MLDVRIRSVVDDDLQNTVASGTEFPHDVCLLSRYS